jgi:glycosyltransferase involved in cell wall biosynthesis
MPTYNRASSLNRAIASVLTQTFPDFELIISDNASTDGTEAICSTYVATDKRIKYIRQSRNQGAYHNFAAVLREARGEYFMWLADDDWIDANYISECMSFLSAHQCYSLVAGRTRFYGSEGDAIREGSSTILQQTAPEERVLSFYKEVVDAAVFYGIARREFLLALHMPRGVGSDCHMLGAIAAAGMIMTLQTTTIHRSANGASKDLASLASYHELEGKDAANPFRVITREAVGMILWRMQPYRALSVWRRAKLSLAVYLGLYERFCMWNAVQPSIWRRISLKAHRWALFVSKRYSNALRIDDKTGA